LHLQEENVTALNVTLSRLIPFADYRVSVKCIPLIEDNADSFSPRGYWSSATDTEFTTEKDGMCTHCDVTSTACTVLSA